MMRKSGGFTLVELMITMIVFVLVIAGASQVFTGLLTQFKQQGKIAETNTQGISGLEILRRDIQQAGYGLPWDLNGATYRETVAESGMTAFTERDYNDGPDDNPARGCSLTTCNSTHNILRDPGPNCSNPPAPLRSGNDLGITNPTGSYMSSSQADVLVIKSAPVAMSDASQRWTYIANSGSVNTLKVWNSTDDPVNSDQIISIDPLNGNKRNLLRNSGGTNFYDHLGDSSFSFHESVINTTNNFEPQAHSYKQFVVYDIAKQDGHGSHIRMPFNRADYFVKRPPTNMPGRCATDPDNANQGTGILYKAVTNNTMYNDKQCPGGGGCTTLYPILDCVADMQVEYILDNVDSSGTFAAKGDGTVDWCPTCRSCGGHPYTVLPTASPTGDISCLTAFEIRNQVKEVRVYIVAQEGQRDTTYDFSQGGTVPPYFTVTMTDPNGSASSLTFNTVNLKNLLCPTGASSCANEYKYYRWKLYTLVVHPDSMR